MLTEGAVRASDKRAQFVGVEAYEAAGGTVLRDLFQERRWRLAAGCRAARPPCRREARSAKPRRSRAEGWKWIEVAPDFPYGHAYRPAPAPRRHRRRSPPRRKRRRDALQAEFDRLSEANMQDADELPDEVDERLGELETALEALRRPAAVFDPAEIARAGVFVSIGADGQLRVERGYVRPEDELPVEPESDPAEGEAGRPRDGGQPRARRQRSWPADAAQAEPDEDEGLSPIPIGS